MMKENQLAYYWRLVIGDTMARYEAIKDIMKDIEDELIICNIGFPSRELYEIDDRDKNFYMIGSMGLASSIGFGLALARDPEEEDKRYLVQTKMLLSLMVTDHF